jgi:hypothetical protein
MKNIYFPVLFSCMLLLSCGGDDVGDGSVCANCSNDSDCNEGLTCESFYNSSGVYERCSEQICDIYGCYPSTSSC